MNVNSISLNQSLRYFFCGLAFILSLLCAAKTPIQYLVEVSGTFVAGTTLICLFIGSAFYAIYRSTLYVWINRIIECLICIRIPKATSIIGCKRNSRERFCICLKRTCNFLKLLLPFYSSKTERNQDKWRWGLDWARKNGNKKDDSVPSAEHKIYNPKLEEWGSQVHFCYTSALAIFLGKYLGQKIELNNKICSANLDVINDYNTCFICALLFAGLFSHIRLKAMEKDLGKPQWKTKRSASAQPPQTLPSSQD